MIKRWMALLLIVSLMITGLAFAEEVTAHAPVVILYTNDVHCGIDQGVSYAGVAAYKKAYAEAGYEVMLVDVGDAIQGEAVGTISKGEYIVDIMNEVGYDVATIGNHEFDYGMDRLLELMDMAEYDYVCCNFTDLEGNPILTPYVIREIGGWKIAFVGIDTPESFTKSTPSYFQDGEGNYIYSFNGGNGGQDMFDITQKYVDQAIAEGAEIVVALSHLGTEFIADDKAWTSSDLIANTNGIDVVLDAHSHSVIECEKVLNKDGEEVLLTSTGTKLASLGSLTISADDEGAPVFETALHTETIFRDEETTAFVADIGAQYAEMLNEVVAHTDVDLVIFDPTAVDADGNAIRIIRTQETNLGDLCADAYRYISGAQIGLVNGGGIRQTIPAGDITYEQVIAVHPFGNMLTVVEATGQQILDALELSAAKLPSEYGGFLQVSGLTFEINMAVESTVVLDENSEFVEVSGERRVQNVLVDGEAIDPEATYTVASHDYMLKEGGDGMNMFKGDTILQDAVMLDNQVLINYISDGLQGNVGEEYAEPYGEGRITIIE